MCIWSRFANLKPEPRCRHRGLSASLQISLNIFAHFLNMKYMLIYRIHGCLHSYSRFAQNSSTLRNEIR